MSGPRDFQGETLSWQLKGQVLEVRLDRAPANEIGLATLAELEGLASFIGDGAGGARAMIISSARPRVFCAGADLRELYARLVARRAGAAGEVRSFLDRIHRVFNTIDAAPITTIAAVEGVCFGGGFELALTCDLIIADKTARFCFPELRLGLIPGFGGIPRLERDVGGAAIRNILLTGCSIRAKRAHDLGLLSQIVGTGQALDAARRAATQATRFDPATTAAAKGFMKQVPMARLEAEKDVFCALFASPVVEAALKSFVESTDVRPYLPASTREIAP